MKEIIFVRHGKPVAAINRWVNARGFRDWVKEYDFSTVVASSRPSRELVEELKEYFLVSSCLLRAIDSVAICNKRPPDLQAASLKEMDIPCYDLPLRAKTYWWLYFNRALWFSGIQGQHESFKEAKVRAVESAELLTDLADKHDKVAVFAHAMINKYTAIELTKMGWKGKGVFTDYWGKIHLTYE